jgi:hypothetical protein
MSMPLTPELWSLLFINHTNFWSNEWISQKRMNQPISKSFLVNSAYHPSLKTSTFEFEDKVESTQFSKISHFPKCYLAQTLI